MPGNISFLGSSSSGGVSLSGAKSAAKSSKTDSGIEESCKGKRF